MTGRPLGATWCLAALLVAGCDGGRRRDAGTWTPTHDLVAELPAAVVASEFTRLDPRALDTRRLLLEGWAQSRSDRAREEPVVWGTGAYSVLDLPLLRSREGLALVLDGSPFVFPGAPAQTVTVEVNGTEVTHLELRPRRARYRIDLAEAPLRAGSNRIRFDYGYSRRPADVLGNRDRRSLAVAWYGIALDPPAPAAAPRSEPEASRLVLPARSGLDLYLALEPGSELAALDWSFRGTRLEVALETDGGGREVIAELRGPPPDGRLVLPGDRRRVARLSLRTGDQGGGVTLTRPQIGRAREPEAVVEDRSASAWRVAPPAPPEPPAGPPNLIVYLIDTLRADHLGCYGYPRPVSPAIDDFARDGVLFERTIAQSSWTRAAVASLFTGWWPAAHGANRRPDKLSSEALTLAELLSASGYRTAAFVTNPNVASNFGFDQGFDEYVLLEPSARDAASVTRAALEWLDRRGDARPFFLYLHTVEPHSPYDPPPAYRRRLAPEVPPGVVHQPSRLARRNRAGREQVDEGLVAEMLALYDAEIAANDYAFGDLLAGLEERELYQDAVVTLLSDHGEEFYDHGHFEHGRALYEESIRVPLIVKLAGDGPTGRIAEPAQQIDMLPTLLELAGVPAPGGIEGRSLVAAMRRGPQDPEVAPERALFSYLHLDGSPHVSVLDGELKLIQDRSGEFLVFPRLFDLARDPGETRELAAERPVLAGYLATLIRHRLHASEGRLQAGVAEIDEGLRESLEALGYL